MNESIESILAEMRREVGDGEDTYCGKRIIRRMDDVRVRQYCDRVEAAWKRELERDERLLFRLLWFDIEDYQSDWACNAYRRTIKDCCAKLGIPYHESGKEIADEMDKSKLGVEVEREVYDE